MELMTPVGRLVQGSVAMQHQVDMETNQKKFNADGSPEMGTFIALAFPKVLPNGQPNAEFGQFYSNLVAIGAQSWPALFPQGARPDLPNGGCVNPRFSWKYQDGDGVDASGKSVADKPGFAGHHIIRMFTSFPLRCYHEGKFAAHEEIQKAEDVVKRGFWVRVAVEVKSNNATGTQVPGISIFPKLLSFVERGEEIVSGPNAEATFGATAVGWRPPASASPIPTGGGVAGVVVPAATGVPAVSVPAVGVPAVGAGPAGVVVPAANVGAAAGVVIPQATPAAAVVIPQAAPTYAIAPHLAAQGVTYDALLAPDTGWTVEAALAAGHIVRV